MPGIYFRARKGIAMKNWMALLTMMFAVLVTGCNTIEGAGRDLERGGEKVQDTARDVKRSM